MVDLLNKEVTLAPLFRSNIFRRPFDYDEWPATSPDTKRMLAPYNDSLFKLRY